MACGNNTNTLQYATLCNIAGGAYYELNKLADCRLNWEKFLKIQDDLLPEGDIEVSAVCARFHCPVNQKGFCASLDSKILDVFTC